MRVSFPLYDTDLCVQNPSLLVQVEKELKHGVSEKATYEPWIIPTVTRSTPSTTLTPFHHNSTDSLVFGVLAGPKSLMETWEAYAKQWWNDWYVGLVKPPSLSPSPLACFSLGALSEALDLETFTYFSKASIELLKCEKINMDAKEYREWFPSCMVINSLLYTIQTYIYYHQEHYRSTLGLHFIQSHDGQSNGGQYINVPYTTAVEMSLKDIFLKLALPIPKAGIIPHCPIIFIQEKGFAKEAIFYASPTAAITCTLVMDEKTNAATCFICLNQPVFKEFIGWNLSKGASEPVASMILTDMANVWKAFYTALDNQENDMEGEMESEMESET
jgi:hypothetical protein